MGHPPVLTSRDHRQLLIVMKRDPTIEYSALRTAAGLVYDAPVIQPLEHLNSDSHTLPQNRGHATRTRC